MSLFDQAKDISEEYKSLAPGLLTHNQTLFNIYEGDLLTYVLKDLEKQLSTQSFEQVKYRVAPINVLKRMVDKLSKIYAKPPSRDVNGGAQKDQDLINWYLKELDIDTNMGMGNEFFNLFKTCFIEPYLDQGNPRLRILPSDRFFVRSSDSVNPTRPTELVKVMGTKKDQAGNTKTILHCYDADRFMIINEDGDIQTALMAQAGNEKGINPYEAIPGIYVNRSRHDLIPKIDTDTLTMTKLIPVLLSDLNYAVMFQSFAILYGIDVDSENLKMSPNSFWAFKSDPATQNKPEIGAIKPEVDIDQVLNFIAAQLSFWLNSRNIRPGTIGVISKENFASGVSKVIDEMDTSEDRQKQVPYFIHAERALWDLLIKNMHPVWIRDPLFKQRIAFSPAVTVDVSFEEQRGYIEPSVKVDLEIKKMNAGLQSRKGALKEINPDWTDEMIEAHLSEIEEERTVMVEEASIDDQLIDQEQMQ